MGFERYHTGIAWILIFSPYTAIRLINCIFMGRSTDEQIMDGWNTQNNEWTDGMPKITDGLHLHVHPLFCVYIQSNCGGIPSVHLLIFLRIPK